MINFIHESTPPAWTKRYAEAYNLVLADRGCICDLAGIDSSSTVTHFCIMNEIGPRVREVVRWETVDGQLHSYTFSWHNINPSDMAPLITFEAQHCLSIVLMQVNTELRDLGALAGVVVRRNEIRALPDNTKETRKLMKAVGQIEKRYGISLQPAPRPTGLFGTWWETNLGNGLRLTVGSLSYEDKPIIQVGLYIDTLPWIPLLAGSWPSLKTELDKADHAFGKAAGTKGFARKPRISRRAKSPRTRRDGQRAKTAAGKRT